MHIEIYDNILDKNDCKNIIEYFENSEQKKKGQVGSNGRGIVNKKVKDSTELELVVFDNDFPTQIIGSKISIGIEKYIKKYPALNKIDSWRIFDSYNIQRYKEGEGYHNIHCEHNGINPLITRRMLVWMIYLNNAKCGTRFYNPKRDIKARMGRLVLWPAFWTHMHSGITPNRGVKYIATGWFNFC